MFCTVDNGPGNLYVEDLKKILIGKYEKNNSLNKNLKLTKYPTEEKQLKISLIFIHFLEI